jgi:hypothetical protein
MLMKKQSKPRSKSLSEIKAILADLANKHKTRRGFNKSLRRVFGFINSGQFREVYSAGRYVVKVRRYEELEFDMEEIDESNYKEYREYLKVARRYPNLAQFIQRPNYVKLPNGHDAVIMKRVEVFDHDNLDEDFDGGDHFNGVMLEQYKFIVNNFTDGHDGNIGWDWKNERLYMIDFNYSGFVMSAESEAKELLEELAH